MTEVPKNNEASSVADVLKHAQRREPAPAATKRRARRALRTHWQENVRQARQRRWRQRGAFAGAAAVMMLAIGIVLTRGPSLPAPVPVGEVLRVLGQDVHLYTTASEDTVGFAPAADGLIIRSNSTLITGNDSRAALRWNNGGSLRVDQNSEIQIRSANRIALIRGAIYFDSVYASATATEGIVVETRLGEITDIGTQFAARWVSGELRVRVREGAVSLASDAGRLAVPAQQKLVLQADGSLRRSPQPSYGSDWQWVDALALERGVNGKAAYDVLAWIGRETGREVRYMSEAAETHARDNKVSGLPDMTPETLLKVIPIALGLSCRESGEAIEISLPDAGERQ